MKKQLHNTPGCFEEREDTRAPTEIITVTKSPPIVKYNINYSKAYIILYFSNFVNLFFFEDENLNTIPKWQNIHAIQEQSMNKMTEKKVYP